MDPAHLSRPPSVPTIVAGETHSSEIKVQTTPYEERNGSRVDIAALDPVGMQELHRSLSKNPVARQEMQDSFSSSNATLAGIAASDGPFDFEKTLQTIVRKRDEAHVQPRTLGVVFEDLEVVGLGASNTLQPTLGSLFSYENMVNGIHAARHPPIRNILSGFEGVVRPGQMLLVLGAPGSGCTTFLKTMANMRDEYYAVNGEVHYDSLSPSDIQKHFRGDVQYCPEDDVHFPTLTVEQTIKFAAKTRAPRSRLGETRKEYHKMIVDILTTLFGLRHAKKTPVGDAAIRGVSGGEKKRVSIAENFATRGCIGAWDKYVIPCSLSPNDSFHLTFHRYPSSTRGLDASTALEYVRALRIATDTFDVTTIVSIYQAGESLYRLFDKVCLIYEGKMAYFGPADQAKQYFLDMGYEPANRQTTADFLVSVTDPNARIVRPGIQSLPRTADEFAEYFKKSSLGATNREDIQLYKNQFVGKAENASAYIASAQAEHAKHVREASPYLISIPMQVRAVMLRRVQIIKGNPLAVGMNLFSFIFQGLIVGSVFFLSPEATSAYFSRGGVLFFSLLFAALTTMAEIPALYAQRPIVHRHKVAALYHPFIEALALTLVDIPITFLMTVLFAIIIYFMVGLQRTAGQFFIFYLFLFTMTITMKGWFRAVAAAFKSEASAQTVAGISILVLSIYTGYSIPKPSMIGALRWITYINPIRYGFEAILTNEFHTLNGKCSTLVPQGPGYEGITIKNQVCTTVGSLPGDDVNYGILVAFAIGFISFLLIFSEFNTSTASDTPVVLYKQGSKTTERVGSDEEALHNEKSITPSNNEDARIEATKEMATQPRMTDIFSWQHINYVVPISGESDRKLLSDVTGYVAPGKLTALMGESGAGKTTLLNVLAQRVNTGVVTGDKYVNGQPLPKDFQAQTGYCQQMDTHMPTATVREALLFSAMLRQPPSVPIAEKEA
ncbi:hypothetical protein H0H81_010505 [Sphagnurus paluster]|uniref:ABC transporter domain-containing protein n=1 Tax=Sphagnurus paluster TaxID=117069 RepID=A0A9P7GKH2_9AGAR|nr:hypothetical protein H0H81_010505 [Sphagnurus paluster]